VDQFENIAKVLLERDGYWVRQSFKVGLSPAQKAALGPNKVNMPRPEIDLLAVNLKAREVIAFEAKCYLDSGGVPLTHLTPKHSVAEGGYKLFTCAKYRKVVLDQLKLDLVACNLIPSTWSKPVRLGLIASKVQKGHADPIAALFQKNNWIFWSDTDVKAKVRKLVDEKHENDPVVITAKILLR